MKILPKFFSFVVILLLLIAILPFSKVRAAGTIYYVKANATGSNDGTSWTNAFTNLQDALTAASAGDEIWVADGTYTPTNGNDRTISFTIKKGIAIYGGFNGTENQLSQRDWNTNISILSGDLGTSNINGYSYHVVKINGGVSNVILDGVTITDGNANGQGAAEDAGGGLYNGSGSSLQLKNIIFTRNRADRGGALYNLGTITISESRFGSFYDGTKVNYAVSGAGIFNAPTGTLTVDRTTFFNALLQDIEKGGGIYNAGNSTVTNSTFTKNYATYGAGIYNKSGNLEIINSTFSENIGLFGGGGIHNLSNLTVTNSTFSNNQAAGIDNRSVLNFTNTILVDFKYGWACYNTGSIGVNIKNLTNNGNCPSGLKGDPKLVPLADNGGPTNTLGLAPGSPAIDAGSATACPSTDQRGRPRQQGTGCDLGATETSRIYVKANASGNNNGTNWANAYTTLETALQNSGGGDELWVAAGTYYPTTSTDRTRYFRLKNRIAIYGGFAGTETLRTQRQPSANPTILSGDIGVLGDDSDNSFHVVACANIENDSSGTLDGFTIRDGNANDTATYQNYGGGLVTSYTNPILANLIFLHNNAIEIGGGIFNSGGDPSLTNVVFQNNTAMWGGGMYNDGGAPTITKSAFIDNTALKGAGMFTTDSSNGENTVLTDVTFRDNSATYGAGLYNENSNIILTRITFTDNLASIHGGGIYNTADHDVTGLTNLTAANLTFEGNQAKKGAGIYNRPLA